MLKQIGIRVEEEMITKAKMYGLDNKLSLQAVFTKALEVLLDNKITSSNDNMITNSITEEDPTALHLLIMAQDAMRDSNTRSITIYPKTMDIDIDQSHIENEVVFGDDYVLNAEEKYNSINKEDLDPEDETEAMILASYEKWGE